MHFVLVMPNAVILIDESEAFGQCIQLKLHTKRGVKVQLMHLYLSGADSAYLHAAEHHPSTSRGNATIIRSCGQPFLAWWSAFEALLFSTRLAPAGIEV